MLSKELKSVIHPILILAAIKEQDNYGYGLIESVYNRTEGVISMKEGTLYPILKKMEKKEWIRSRWRQSKEGKKRKYYSISEKGKRALLDMNNEISIVKQWLN